MLKRLGWVFAILCFLVLAGVGAVGYKAYRLYRQTAGEIDRRVGQVAELFRELFHDTPHLVVDHKTVWSQTAPIAEFAVVSKEGDFEQEWQQTRFLSTKRVVIRAKYLAKAGFDLNRNFEIDTDRKTGEITALLPPAQILSVELKSDLEVHGENGLINWLSDADIAEALKYFREQVTRQAEESGLPVEAETEALRRLEALAAQAGVKARFTIATGKEAETVEPAMGISGTGAGTATGTSVDGTAR